MLLIELGAVYPPPPSLPPSLPASFVHSFVCGMSSDRTMYVIKPQSNPIQSGLLSFPSPSSKKTKSSLCTPLLIEENLRSITSILHQSFFRSKKVGGGRRGSPHREREWWEGEGGGASCIVKSKKKKKKKAKREKKVETGKKGLKQKKRMKREGDGMG